MKKWPDIERVLLSETVLQRRVKELGRRISRDYRGEKVVLVSVLKGSVVFLADLIRAISVPCAVDFLAVSSYAGSESSGEVRLTMDLRESPEQKNVLLVEDIVDTGLTLNYIKGLLAAHHVKSLKVCALLDKPACRRIPVALDYLGFSIPDEFVVGYGLDYAERFRNLPFIGVLRPSFIRRGGVCAKRRGEDPSDILEAQ
ncbi:MAG: hypoxanthine phosphoribosyltransferase [Elusimicrobia bacterium]|nr:hypoxanthine phosphoribosyltransferase [Elusimicrobiota bacterium]